MGSKTTLNYTDFHFMDKKQDKGFLQISYMFHRRKKAMQTWNDTRMRKLWQFSFMGVIIPLLAVAHSCSSYSKILSQVRHIRGSSEVCRCAAIKHRVPHTKLRWIGNRLRLQTKTAEAQGATQDEGKCAVCINASAIPKLKYGYTMNDCRIEYIWKSQGFSFTVQIKLNFGDNAEQLKPSIPFHLISWNNALQIYTTNLLN